ncbi:TetR/AcrR family transcriptional regulator [Novosphingobium sp. FSW06-99]|uniref:TetR/AcrR family transcriptional regulator n=1 Tax=Novosphingobium sp. FSW06-99 TaxID=1739113 RepID=UPI00076BEC0E|nr:TetR/AcrR family transcriptional regulator [Novosphingobium sp. FSW06-99]KUR75011.1 hypothetical protein AQZ49_16170 [Novosphingobium sp. FSW06-99]
MKVSKAQASENRDAIIRAAAAQLRLRGFDQMSVAEVARAAGLTHGALYSHFKSKDELAAAAIRAAFAQTLQAFTGASMDDFLAWYLSASHRDHPEAGCPNAALAGEVARQPATTQQAFRDGLENFVGLAGETLERAGREHGRDRVITVFAAMVGGLALSRAIRDADPAGSDAILQAIASQIQALI